MEATEQKVIKQQKIYKPLLLGVCKALEEIFVEDKKADHVLAGILKSNPKWGSRDRAFIAENTYEIVRNWRLVKYCVGLNETKISEENDFLKLLGTWLLLKEVDISSVDYFEALDQKNIFKKHKEALKVLKIKYSIPDWLDTLGEEEFGKNWENELKVLHTPAEVFLRVNILKITTEKLINRFAKKEIILRTVPDFENALKLEKRTNLGSSDEYKLGFFEIQDVGSQQIAEFLDLKPGMNVIDACAGAGGKTLHIGTLMENKGKIMALDIENSKLEELKRRTARNGIRCVETQLISDKTVSKFFESSDRLLLDVPCSGLGVLRRNPDAKWKIKPDFIEEIKKIQKEILESYSKMLKKGGKMVYATCSIFKGENEDQVLEFLKNNANFELEAEKRIYPAKDGFDGFYMARLIKK